MTKKWSKNELARVIDHTILKSFATTEQIIQTCKEAIKYNFASVCTNPVYSELISLELKGTNVKPCTVVGFPLGANTFLIKSKETRLAIEQGIEEIDMVMNIGALKSQEYNKVEEDIAAVVAAAHGKIVKVIIETCYLNENEKIKACEIILKSNAHFVKTSTGFSKTGATVEDVMLIRKIVGNRLKIKASGGILTLEDALKLLDAGADRLGASSGINIINKIIE